MSRCFLNRSSCAPRRTSFIDAMAMNLATAFKPTAPRAAVRTRAAGVAPVWHMRHCMRAASDLCISLRFEVWFALVFCWHQAATSFQVLHGLGAHVLLDGTAYGAA